MKHELNRVVTGSRGRWLSVGVRSMLALGFLAGAAGCAVENGGTVDADADMEGTSQALQGSAPGFEFRQGSSFSSAGFTTVDPAVCGGAAFFMVAQNATTLRYQTLAWLQGLAPSWSDFGTRQFVSRPACSYLNDPSIPDGRTKFVLVGKSTDNKLYFSLGHQNLGAPPAVNPSVDTGWAVISNDAYPNTPNDAFAGSPAVAIGRSRVVVVVKGQEGDNRHYAYYRPVPFTAQNSWSVRQLAPMLPTGWIPAGSPTIAITKGTINRFTVVVRAKNAQNQMRLYRAYFQDTGFSSPSWTQVTLPVGTPAISSDPAIEWSDVHATNTLYFRSGTSLYQTSGQGPTLGTLAVTPLLALATSGPATGSPQANGDTVVDVGTHLVITRSTNGNTYVGESIDSNISSP